MASNDGMLSRPRRHSDFNLGVVLCKSRESVLEESAFDKVSNTACLTFCKKSHSHHAARAASPVAIMEFKTFALQNKCADAVLQFMSAQPESTKSKSQRTKQAHSCGSHCPDRLDGHALSASRETANTQPVLVGLLQFEAVLEASSLLSKMLT